MANFNFNVFKNTSKHVNTLDKHNTLKNDYLSEVMKDLLNKSLNYYDKEYINKLFTSKFDESVFSEKFKDKIFKPEDFQISGSSKILYHPRYGRFYRYLMYDYMEKLTPELASGLQTYIEYSTQTNVLGQILEFKLKPGITEITKETKETLRQLQQLVNDLQISSKMLRKMFRYVYKYGDTFIRLKFESNFSDGELFTVTKKGISELEVYSPYFIKVVTNKDGNIMGYLYESKPISIPFISAPMDYNFVSMAQASGTLSLNHAGGIEESSLISLDIIADEEKFAKLSQNHNFIPKTEMIQISYNEDIYTPYGTSIFEELRRDWKLYMIAKDLWGIGQMTKGTAKRVYNIKFPNAKIDEDMLTEFNEIINNFKNKDIIINGEYDTRGAVESILSDFFIPETDEFGLSIGTGVEAIDYSGFKEFVEYLESKMFIKLKIPKALLAYEKDLNGKNTLIEEVESFLLTINSSLQEIAEQFFQVFYIHFEQIHQLSSLYEIEMSFAQPHNSSFETSKIDTLNKKIEAYKTIVDIASTLAGEDKEIKIDIEYMLSNLGLPVNFLKIIPKEKKESTEEATFNIFKKQLQDIKNTIEEKFGETIAKESDMGEVISNNTEKGIGEEKINEEGFGEGSVFGEESANNEEFEEGGIEGLGGGFNLEEEAGNMETGAEETGGEVFEIESTQQFKKENKHKENLLEKELEFEINKITNTNKKKAQKQTNESLINDKI